MPFFRRKRIDLRRNREIETNVWKHVFLGVLLLLGIALCVTALWYVTRLASVTISEIVILGGETIPHESVEGAVHDVLKGSYLRVVPYTFAYTVPNLEIVSALSSIPRIKDVQVERTSRTALRVTFDEYIPTALWCMSSDELSPCYFVDGTGYAFSLAPPLRGGSFIRHIVEGTERLEERQILPTPLFEKAHTFTSALETERGLRISYVTHTKEADSIYHLSGNGNLMVTTDMDVKETIKNLSAILESKEFNHLEPGNFNYIDLRFGKKAFVNEQMTIGTTTATTTLPE